jgi:tetratricopeptide (TPR) repeat protein
MLTVSTSHKRRAAQAVSLLLATSALCICSAQATEPAHAPLVLTAYSNGAGGQTLMDKHYDQALAEIRAYKPQLSLMASAKANNLCVALAATRQLTDAKTACSSALTAAKWEKLASTRFAPGSTQENSYIAIAYANRAVVYILSQDMESAKADLERAQALAPKADFVARNLAAASSPRSTIAQLDVAAR